LSIVLTDKQAEIYNTFFNEPDTRWILSVGGKGSAKTTVSVIILLTLFFDERFKNSQILIARESLRDLKNTLVSEFKKKCAEIGAKEDEVFIIKDDLQYIENLITGTKIFYLSLSDRNQQYRSVLSYEFNVVVIDELDRISEEAFDEVSQRMRLPHKFNKGLLNLNPVPETHWVYRKFVKNEFPQTKVIKSSSYDNYIKVKIPVHIFTSKAKPYVYEDKEYYVIDNTRYEVIGRDGEYILAKKYNLAHSFYVEMEHRNYAFKRVMLNGEWGSAYVDDGLYTSTFTEDNVFKGVITPKDLQYFYKPYAGLDFGFRRPAFVLLAEDEWGRLIVIDELLGENVSTIQFIDLVRKRLREKWKLDALQVEWFGDIAGRQASQSDGVSIINRIRQEYNIDVITNKVPVLDSVGLIRELLDKDIRNQKSLQVSPDAPISMAGFLGEFKMDDFGKPIKDGYYDHIHDAIRYAVWGVARQNKYNTFKVVVPEY
jgi:PBSX family phage terminase large subunit